ncbi:hypothetical protein Q9189_002993 [Teloschistes chrysophthalmus]
MPAEGLDHLPAAFHSGRLELDLHVKHKNLQSSTPNKNSSIRPILTGVFTISRHAPMTSIAATSLSTLSTARSKDLTQPGTTESGLETLEPRTSPDSSKIASYGSPLPSPPFRYHASLHPLDADPPASQAHPAIVSPQPPNPFTAALNLQMQANLDKKPTEESSSTPSKLSPLADVEIPIYQASSSSANPLVRTSSLGSALAASRHRAGSLSPSSAFSSPGVGPLVDMTPLPSPMAALGSSAPWTASFDQSADNAANSEMLQIVEEGADDAEQVSSTRSSPKKHRIPLRIDPEIMKMNAASHARNRSLSDYVPEGIPIPRTRNIAVSGQIAPMSATPRSPPETPMHREEYLAVQRGIALPVPKPPTPPRSDQASEDKTGLENRSLSPPVEAQASSLTYKAQDLGSGKVETWLAVRPLGKGTFSTVMLATSQIIKGASPSNEASVDESQLDSKSLVAVKICEQGPAGGADEQKVELSLKRELEILKSIHHPSLVHLKAVSIEDRRALLILNYCPGGDLFELASLKLNLLVPGLIRRIFAELVSAVRYLHDLYIVHRDIKLENVLVNLPPTSLPTIQNWQTHPHPIVTLTDLGLGRRIPPPPESPLLDTRCGSEDYAAPEVLMGQEYDGRATDAWALGVLLYAIMEGRLPFDPVPGARRKSPTSHRIARCEWSWVRWADGDGEWDAGKGGELEGGGEVVEGLLVRASRRWALEKVAGMEWVRGGLGVEL